jgi:hypothetical protein
MSLFGKLFGKKTNGIQTKTQTEKEPEHAVIVYFDYGIEGLEPIHQLGDKLEKVISDNNVGEYDGHEIAMDYSDGKTIASNGEHEEPLIIFAKATMIEIGQHTWPSSTC